MLNETVTKMAKVVGETVTKSSPSILTGLGMAGVVATAVCAHEDTLRAEEKLKSLKEKHGDKVPLKERVLHVYSEYIPTVCCVGVTGMCIVGSNSIHAKRNAALAAGYALTHETLKLFKEEAKEMMNDKKFTELKYKVAKRKYESEKAKPTERNTVILMNEDSQQMFYEAISGRYFRSNVNKIRRIESILNRRLIDEMFISLNEFYYEIGLPEIKMGDHLGWNVNDGIIEIDFSTQLDTDMKPCIVIDSCVLPRQGWY